MSPIPSINKRKININTSVYIFLKVTCKDGNKKENEKRKYIKSMEDVQKGDLITRRKKL